MVLKNLLIVQKLKATFVGSKMKRDMELIRKILLKLSDHEHGFATQEFKIDGFTDEQVGYHCMLLDEAGLIKARDDTRLSSSSPCSEPERLTWEGHEFIENARDENIWGQAKAAVDKIGDVSFSVWGSVLSQVVIKTIDV